MSDAAANGSEKRTGKPARRDQSSLDRLLAYQNNVITWQQARACGLSHSAVHRRVAVSRRWQRILPGVYLAVTGTPTLDQRDLAALLYAGRAGTLTGIAALRWHGMCEVRSDLVDVLVPVARRLQSTGYVVIHQTRRLPPQVCYQGPVQYALAARAVADAARELSNLSRVRAIVAAAVQTRRCTVEQLTIELEEGPVRGSALLRTALAEVAQGARSGPEAELLALVRRGGLPMPMFNPTLYAGSDLLAVPDAWWPTFEVVVEIDSREWHLSGGMGAHHAKACEHVGARHPGPAFHASPAQIRAGHGAQHDPQRSRQQVRAGRRRPHLAGGLLMTTLSQRRAGE